jgi:hypothetical protein
VIDAPLLVALANAGRPRRPPGARRAAAEDPFAASELATRALTRFLGRPVLDPELDELRLLAREASALAERLADGEAASPDTVNRLAAGCPGRAELRVSATGAVRAHVDWGSGGAAAVLARRLIEELGAIEPGRLRRCARPECGLLFYDSSRSGTRRWHSEVPCGWRERQRRHRRRS